MNKAFVREPDDSLEVRCPRCKVIGTPVARHTVLAHVPESVAAGLSDTGYFCNNPRCDAAYYDALGQSVGVEHLSHSVFPKDAEAPICSCLRVKAEEIASDARAGRTDRVRQIIAHAQSAEARCGTLAANGCPCVGELQRYYLKCKAEGGVRR